MEKHVLIKQYMLWLPLTVLSIDDKLTLQAKTAKQRLLELLE